MNQRLDPKQFGLSSRTVIERIGPNHYSIVVLRKSRIIMSDGLKLLEKVKMIRDVKPDKKVSLKTTAPVCSKTETFLGKNNITVIRSS